MQMWCSSKRAEIKRTVTSLITVLCVVNPSELFSSFFLLLQVNLNTVLSFNQRSNAPFPRAFPISGDTLISPYWENFETVRGFGNASYRNTTDPTLLRRTQLYLRDIFPSARDFSPSYLVIATWDNVPTTGVTTDSDLVRSCKKPVTNLGLYTYHIDSLVPRPRPAFRRY